jgi:hypothetical protein
MFAIVTFYNKSLNERAYRVHMERTRYPNIFMFKEQVVLDESQLQTVASMLNDHIAVFELGNDKLCVLKSGKTIGLYGTGADVEYTIHDLDTPDHRYKESEFQHASIPVNNDGVSGTLMREINKQDYGNTEGSGPAIGNIVEASDMSGVPCDMDRIYCMGEWDMSKMMSINACNVVRPRWGY